MLSNYLVSVVLIMIIVPAANIVQQSQAKTATSWVIFILSEMTGRSPEKKEKKLTGCPKNILHFKCLSHLLEKG